MSARGEMRSIALSLTAVCAAGALVLGVTYVLTERAQRATEAAGEKNAITSLLDLQPGDRLVVIAQSYQPVRREVTYRAAAWEGAGATTRLTFDLDGRLVGREAAPAGDAMTKGSVALGRLFVAYRGPKLVGFVVDGTTQGYKNRVRFLVGLSDSCAITGVRVIEHEEDPGLGAEIARAWFGGQFIGHTADALPALTVTRDPMPEDWKAALERLDRVPAARWQADEAPLVARESAHPIYAVTGATISSRALTDGVRSTVTHFRHRWALLAPALEAAP